MRLRTWIGLGVPFVGLAASLASGACSASSGSSDNAGFGGDSNTTTLVGGTQAGQPNGSGTTNPAIAVTVGTGGAGGGTELTGDPTTCADAAKYRTYVGCDFWPTVTANMVWSIFDYAVVVANASPTPADVTVQRNGATAAQATVQPNSLQTLYLPWVPELKGPDADGCGNVSAFASSVVSQGGAYHLTSSVPVTVYQFNALEYLPQGGPPGKNWGACPADPTCGVGCASYSNDASLLLPSTALTGNYRITGESGWVQANLGDYMAITATQDNTQVTAYISGNGNVLAGNGVAATAAHGQLQLTLNAGDVAELVASATSDLAGSLVQASAPVQVITGMPCVFLPAGQEACDHIEETVMPAETLGKHYFVEVPSSPHGTVYGHIVRIYGNIDGTNLNYPSGAPPGAPLTISSGQVIDLGVVKNNFEIVGDHEFAIGSFTLGASLVDAADAVQNQEGDPDESQAVAVEQYRDKYVFLAPADYAENYVDIVEPTGTVVTIDGQTVSAVPTAISSGYGVARVTLGAGMNGAHALTATNPVGIQVVGYGAYTSYRYPGGLNLHHIAAPPPPPK